MLNWECQNSVALCNWYWIRMSDWDVFEYVCYCYYWSTRTTFSTDNNFSVSSIDEVFPPANFTFSLNHRSISEKFGQLQSTWYWICFIISLNYKFWPRSSCFSMTDYSSDFYSIEFCTENPNLGLTTNELVKLRILLKVTLNRLTAYHFLQANSFYHFSAHLWCPIDPNFLHSTHN